MNVTLHVCKTCGKEYYHCDDCGAIDSIKKVCCSDDCYKVFYIVSRYLADRDAIKAADSLSNIGKNKLSGHKYISPIASAISEIFEKSEAVEAIVDEMIEEYRANAQAAEHKSHPDAKKNKKKNR